MCESPDRRAQIARIQYYEALLDRLQQGLAGSDPASLRPAAAELERYYGSADWKRDFADDEAGLLPRALKRGVLSEDGIWNALEALRERAEEEEAVDGFEKKSYPVFDLFENQWALVAAGSPERYNACTVGWGSLGTLWPRPGRSGSVVTVYVHPARYTQSFLLENEYFTLSFFPESCRKALAYMGSHSGRDGDKAAACGLTPVPMGESVGFREAELSFVCKKLYQHQFDKAALAPEIRDYYSARPKVFPAPDGGWQPHWLFIGEIVAAEDLR